MKCCTIINQSTGDVCGHSISAHDGDESGMGGAEPCGYTHCPCNDFTEEPRKILPSLGKIMQGGPHVMKVDGGMIVVMTTIQFVPDSAKPADPDPGSAGTEMLGDYDH